MKLTQVTPILLFLPLAVQSLSAQTVTVANATLIDVSNGTLHPRTTVVIEGNRIVRVGPASASPRPTGQVIDGTGLYLIPGLWDMHVHVYFDWPRSFGGEYVLPSSSLTASPAFATWEAISSPC
jgi:imidazolonepropionase-like amidohydrolase